MIMDAKLLIFLTFIIRLIYGDERYRCPKVLAVNNYLKTHEEYCFEFIAHERSWNGAHSDCLSRGGHLVVVRDAYTQRFLVSTLRELRWPRNGVWIGASDQRQEMNWKWVTGELVRSGYSNWASSQPSCHILCFEDCALMRFDEGGKWHDYKCDWIEDYSYVCQYRMLPKTSTTTTTTTSTTTTTAALTTSSTSTTTASMMLPTSVSASVRVTTSRNITENNSGVVVKLKPDVKVELYDNVHSGMLQTEEHHSLSAGSMVGLILGLVCGICLGLCLGIFVIRRRNKKHKEELPTMVFANPYYGDVRTTRRDTRHEESRLDCCFGSSSTSENSTPVKQPLTVDVDRAENVYDSDPTLTPTRFIPRPWGEDGAGQYDEIKPKVQCYMPGHLEDEGACGGEIDMLWDNHYDYTTGENFYESVDSVRHTIEQNLYSQQHDDPERYVPFQLDTD